MTDENRIPDDGEEVRGPGSGSEENISGPAPQAPDSDAEAAPDADAPQLSDDDLDLLSGQTTAEALAEERLADLQRLSAEYANYRKRTEDTRVLEQQRITGEALKALLPVLDDLDRAAKHGDLEGESPFATIALKLRNTVQRMGLTSFGEVGDTFDHNIHEAIFQQPTPDAEAETVIDVVETGYWVGDTLLRAAKVVVAVPTE